jgi:hypothetical protein
MVERMLSMHEAQGSIPCSSTFCFVLFWNETKTENKNGFNTTLFPGGPPPQY